MLHYYYYLDLHYKDSIVGYSQKIDKGHGILCWTSVPLTEIWSSWFGQGSLFDFCCMLCRGSFNNGHFFFISSVNLENENASFNLDNLCLTTLWLSIDKEFYPPIFSSGAFVQDVV